jgi:hypothetical protein
VAICRSHAFPMYLLLTGLLVGGCGGSGDVKQPPAGSPSKTAAAPSTPRPSYGPDEVASSLLQPKEIGPGAKRLAATIKGIKEKGAPSCSDSSIKLPGRPQLIARQFGPESSRYVGSNYAYIAAIYDDGESAAQAFDAIKSKVNACPSKRHVPAKKLPGNLIAVQHDDTWKVTEDNLSGWTHIRGLEKKVEPPSSGIYNVRFISYDYVIRGNAVFSSVYFERVKRTASGDPVAKRATKLLTKQLQKIG